MFVNLFMREEINNWWMQAKRDLVSAKIVIKVKIIMPLFFGVSSLWKKL